MSEFRTINRAVGITPKFGSFALYQVVPIFGIAIIIYYLKAVLNFSWVIAAVLVGASGAIVLLVLGDKPWLFFGRIMKVPYIVRGGAWYQPLLGQNNGHSNSN